MNARQIKDVCDRVDQEGFDYCFCSYSDFEKIKDAEFHDLRKAYVKAAESLKEYLGLD